MTETVKPAYFFEYPPCESFDMPTNKWLKDSAAVPSSPPWSTWNGRIHCSPTSWVGKVMLADPASMTVPLVVDRYRGNSINSVDDQGYSNGVKVPGKEDWVNGKWFAPKDWQVMPMNTDRAPTRKRVPDWVAVKRDNDRINSMVNNTVDV